jgi:prepilin-type N-terminal cleavage/methylation domain-containing protein
MTPAKDFSVRRLCFPGFTLIELLAVIAILSLLAALLFPVFAAARRSARMSTCSSNLHQIGLALQMYHSDWGRMPTEGPVDSYISPGWKGRDPLEPYTRNGGIYHCPEAEAGLAGNYLYRAAFSLTFHESGELYINDNRTIVLQPTSVLAYCMEHSKQDRAFRNSGSFIVLRADISVQRIPGERAPTWGYHDKWLAPPLVSPPSPTHLFPVFPDEPWPPQFDL